MGIMKKIVDAASTKYGVVLEGKYKGCLVGLGYDADSSESIILTNPKITHIVFYEGNEEKARCEIRRFKCFKEMETTEEGEKILAVYRNEEESLLLIEYEKEDNDIAKMLKGLAGLKPNSQRGTKIARFVYNISDMLER